MRTLNLNRAQLVWAVLVAATLVSWALGTDHGMSNAHVSSAVIIAIAFVKVRLVGRYFMELRNAPRALSGAFDAWIVVVGLAVLAMYLIST